MPKPVDKQTWDEWYTKVYGYFYRRVENRNDVEDLTSSVLHDYFLKEETITHPKALMWTIARNKLYTFFKQKSNTHQVYSLDDESESDDNGFADREIHPSSFYEAKMSHLLECVKKQLSGVDFDIVEMSILCDFSGKRVAEETGLTPGNVRQRLFRSVNKLREKCRNVWQKEW
jgi:RNA polymerase sigma factor (sigma-70 family)